jgi:hypothetical protein
MSNGHALFVNGNSTIPCWPLATPCLGMGGLRGFLKKKKGKTGK